MKFKVLLSVIALCLLSLIGFSQKVVTSDTTGTGAMIASDTAQVTFSKVYNDVKAAVTSLSSSLKVGVDHVYAMLIRQQKIKGIVGIVLSLLTIAAAISLFKWIKFVSASKDMDWDDMLPVVGTIMLSILSVALCIGFFATLQNTLTAFLNPEYGALQDILSKIDK